MKTWAAIGTSLITLGIMLGAFAAHSLKNSLSPYTISVFEKAVFYQFINAFGIIAITLLASNNFLTIKSATSPLTLILAGTVIFSGSLYLLAITDLKWLGMITPIGGVLMILGWILVSYLIFKN